MHFVNYCISHYLAGFLAIAGFFVCVFVLMCVSFCRAKPEPPKWKTIAENNAALLRKLAEDVKRPE
jgi:hypothetical protein